MEYGLPCERRGVIGQFVIGKDVVRCGFQYKRTAWGFRLSKGHGLETTVRVQTRG